METINQLPFASLTNEEFYDALQYTTSDLPSELNFNPITVQDDKYNNELDVNNFYLQLRQLKFPNTEYIFIDDLSLSSDSCLITLFFMNIRSIPSNMNNVIDMVLSQNLSRFNVLGFAETRLDSDLTALYQLQGYNMFTKCRNRYGGGVALNINSEFCTSVLNNVTFSEPYVECVCVECIISGKLHFFACIYRPPSGNMKNFLDKLTEILSFAHSKNYYSMHLLGDWNIDLLKHHENKNVFEFINLMYSFSLFPIITKPTRIIGTTATLIDNIWTSKIELTTSSYIMRTDLTDHFPIVSQFKNHEQFSKNNSSVSMHRNINDRTLKLFRDVMSETDWSNVLQSQCPNEAFNIFYDRFYSLFQRHFPIQQVRVNKKHEISPYITPTLRKCIKERNRLERLAKKWPLTYAAYYRKYRNSLTSTLRAAKNMYYQDKLKDNQGNPKTHWTCINSILGRTPERNKEVIKLEPPCQETDVPNKFNYHFLNIANIPHNDSNNNHYRQYLLNSPDYSFYLPPVDIIEVKRYLKALNPNAPGYDDVPPKILKYIASSIDYPLTHIINLIFRKGISPDKLKTAKVTPIHKSGSKTNLLNYRPISVLPAFSKIVE